MCHCAVKPSVPDSLDKSIEQRILYKTIVCQKKKVSFTYRIYSNTIRILFKPAPLIEPAVVLSKFPIIPAANRACHEIEPADCNRINTVCVYNKYSKAYCYHTVLQWTNEAKKNCTNITYL